jgi:hypothetical protein
MSDKQTNEENPFERLMIFVVATVLTLVSFSFVLLVVAMVLAKIIYLAGHAQTEWAFATIIVSSVIISFATCILVAKRSGNLFRNFLAFTRSRIPEPVVSGIVFGIVGALLFGAAVPAVFLLLGHASPFVWGPEMFVFSMGFGFLVFLLVGLQSGLIRKQSQDR